MCWSKLSMKVPRTAFFGDLMFGIIESCTWKTKYFDFLLIFVSEIRGKCGFWLLLPSPSPCGFFRPYKPSTFLSTSHGGSTVFLDVSPITQICCSPITLIFSITFCFVLFFFSKICNSCNCRMFARCKLLVLSGNI